MLVTVKQLHAIAKSRGFTMERTVIGYNEGWTLARDGKHIGRPSYKIETISEALCTVGLTIMELQGGALHPAREAVAAGYGLTRESVR